MSAAHVASLVLAGLATALVVACCVGVLAMPDAYRRLHYATPVGVVAPVLIALSVTLAEGWSNQATTAWLVAVLLAAGSPVVGHVTARAIRTRAEGDWRVDR